MSNTLVAMNSECCHLIVSKIKTVHPVGETFEVNFLCSIKRANQHIKQTINAAFQRQTQISVAGYTCYYHDNKLVTCTNCPKYEANKQYSLFEKSY